MKPELLVSKAIARKGVIPADEVVQLARYAASMRDFAGVMLRAYGSAEDYALRGGSRDACADALEQADDLIEEWAEALYGENWHDALTQIAAERAPTKPDGSGASVEPDPRPAPRAAS